MGAVAPRIGLRLRHDLLRLFYFKRSTENPYSHYEKITGLSPEGLPRPNADNSNLPDVVAGIRRTLAENGGAPGGGMGTGAEARVPQARSPGPRSVGRPEPAPTAAAPDSAAHVTANEHDPLHQGRIQVEFEWEHLDPQASHQRAWLHTLTPYGGGAGGAQSTSYNGFYSVPEIGERVLVEFLGDWDPEAVVIGGIRPGSVPESHNQKRTKRWRTPEGNAPAMHSTWRGRRPQSGPAGEDGLESGPHPGGPSGRPPPDPFVPGHTCQIRRFQLRGRTQRTAGRREKTAAKLDAFYHRLAASALLPACRALNPGFFAWIEQRGEQVRNKQADRHVIEIEK